MKKFTLFARNTSTPKRLLNSIPLLCSFLLALVSGFLLFNTAFLNSLTTGIIDTGLDPLRALLIAALLMTAGAALLGAIVGRRKLGAILGAGLAFLFSYLIPFIQLELQPVHNPVGIIEPLNSGALLHTACVMAALALLSAFVGAVVGVASGEVLLDPPYQLLWLIWHRTAKPHASATWEKKVTSPKTTPTTASVLSSWTGTSVILVLLVLASAAGDLFVFSPDVGLHILPTLHTKQGVPTYGTIVQDSLVSPALGGQRKPFLVYLPPSYNTAAGQAKQYPTLYLLHGSPGNAYDWITGGKVDQAADTLIDLGKIPELIMVLPDGNGRPGASSEWGNSFDRHQLMETYVAHDLVKYVDSKYRTLSQPSDRAIGGLSMGGFGAMNIAVHHPNIFGIVISLGGYYHAEGSIWGDNAASMQANSPAETLFTTPLAWKLHIFLGAATKDQPYYTYTQQFARELDTLHIPYHLDVQIGYHSWKVWQVQAYNALPWIRWG